MMTINEVMEAIEEEAEKEFFHVQNSYDSVIVPYLLFAVHVYFGFSFEHYRQFKVLLR